MRSTGPLADYRTTRLAIVDDHALARDGLQDTLADEPDIDVVGEAADGREAVVLCSRLQPDVVLMDVRIPDIDGLTATREIKRRHPRSSVLMVTMHENPDYGISVSESTVSRMLRRLGWSRKKDQWQRQSATNGLAATLRAVGFERLVFVDEMGANVSLCSLYEV